MVKGVEVLLILVTHKLKIIYTGKLIILGQLSEWMPVAFITSPGCVTRSLPESGAHLE